MASFEEIVDELHNDHDWMVRALAIRKLMSMLDRALEVVGRLFELTFDEKRPIQDHSSVIIRRMGSIAVPFLIRKANSEYADHRARAIELLTEAGPRFAKTTTLREQRLVARDPRLPDWSCDPSEVFGVFRHALNDTDLRVRFAAASALEEFGVSLDETVPVFTETLLKGTQHAQNWAALRLGRIGSAARDACDALHQMLTAPCERTRLAAINAIDLIGCERNIEPPPEAIVPSIPPDTSLGKKGDSQSDDTSNPDVLFWVGAGVGTAVAGGVFGLFLEGFAGLIFGGGMIPLAFMPSFMSPIGSASPVKWSVLAMEGAIWRGFTFTEMLVPCGILLAAGAVCLTVGTIVLTRATT